MVWHLTPEGDDYEAARSSFEWDVPEGYNVAEDLLRKHEDTERVALYQAFPDGRRETYTFADLDRRSSRLADSLSSLGVGWGDRVAVVLSQTPANPLTHLACWKLGAVTVPLSVLFGDDALRYRFDDSGAMVAVVDAGVRETVDAVRGDCPDLAHVVTVDDDGTGGSDGDAAGRRDGDATGASGDEGAGETHRFAALVERGDPGIEIADTTGDTDAVVLYTSGSTGPPKGVLHTQDVWLGHCPAFYAYFERTVLEGTFWTPADWAWIGALGDLLFPAWHYGRPVVGAPMEGFDPERAFALLDEFDVTHTFLPPTAIRMMMGIDAPGDRYDLSLEAIASGGEPLTPEIVEWADEALSGVVVNELYGQTEANLLVCHCRGWFPARPGSMGKPVPGHDVAVIDPETGAERPVGEVGEIAVRREGDPVVFESYWGQPEKTAAARTGPWHRTGDLGVVDEDGYFHFKSRADDLIITAGYRVGPGEVESAVLEHPDVEQVGVVGVPDDERHEIIKAFVQPVDGAVGSDELRASIRDLVADHLARHEYPREIEFVETLPQTTTGKIQRTALREGELDG